MSDTVPADRTDKDSGPPSIYEFLDYRAYLRAAYDQKKRRNPCFSHRVFSQHLGLRSSGHLLYVMQGKRRMTHAVAQQIASFLKLRKQETEYLFLLLAYTHAASQNERQLAFQRLAALRHRAVRSVAPSHYEFYRKWYYSAIREAIGVVRFTGDFGALASRLLPPITAVEAREAVEVLERLGFIFRNKQGFYEQTEPVISTGDVWSSAAIRDLQARFVQLGGEAIERVPKPERDISNLTLSISGDTLELVKQRIAHLRAEILEMARADSRADRVVECCFLVYPLVAPPKGADR